jgi:hypothetical protein
MQLLLPSRLPTRTARRWRDWPLAPARRRSITDVRTLLTSHRPQPQTTRSHSTYNPLESSSVIDRGPLCQIRRATQSVFVWRILAVLSPLALAGGLAPMAYAAEEHGYIAGKVTAAATGEPIGGVKVCAVNLNGVGPWGCTTTAGSGEYTASVFESGKYEVRFTAPSGSGYVANSYYDDKYFSSEQETVSVTLGSTTSGIDAQLPEGGQILGTVTNAITKEPVAQVEVCAGPVECAMTNARGEYTISGLPGGEYQVSFGFGYGGNLGERYIAPEYYKNIVFTTLSNEPNKVSVPLGGVVAGVNQELEEFSRISGRVINSVTKAPIAGIWVNAYNGTNVNQSDKTNSNGEYTLSHLADSKQEYYLNFEVPINSGINYFSEHYGGGSAGEFEDPVEVPYGHTDSGVDMELEEGGEITGRVINAVTKAPIAGLDVFEHSLSGEQYEWSSTNPNGEYTVDLLETGQDRVEFFDFNHNYVPQVYDDKGSVVEATPISVTQGKITTGIDAEMEAEPPLNLVWTGQHNNLAGWSSQENWEGGIAPGNGTAIGDLTFPAISPCSDDCYSSVNDLSELTVESLRIDDGENYEISGEPLTLGAGGLSASPSAATSKATFATVLTPIVLSSSQTWSITGLGGDQIDENALLLAHGLSGSSSKLTVDMEGGGALYLARDNEAETANQLGPVSFIGANTHQAGIFNGVIGLLQGQLNSADGEPVNLDHVFLIGTGSLGALRSVGSEMDVTTDGYEGGTLEAQSATLDSQSELELEITGSGPNAGIDYSDLYSPGAVEVGGATLVVRVAPPKAGEACPTLVPNATYTLVSTTGTLSGAFGNAPEGTEIPIEFAKACSPTSQTLRIEYHRAGTTKTVTGTVIGPRSSTALSVLPSDPATNQSVTLTATIQATSVTPSGNVEFMNGGSPIASCNRVPVSQVGAARCLTTFAAAGSPVRLSAVFTPSPGTDLEGSESPTENLTVQKSTTTTTLHTSATTVTAAQSVTYTARVSPPNGGPSWPLGSVEFFDAGTPIPTCEAQPLSGQASCQVTYTIAGTHSIAAAYSGDGNFDGSSSPSQSVAVQGPPSSAETLASPTLGANTSTGMSTAPEAVRPGSASLLAPNIAIHGNGSATIELDCEGRGTCSGVLTVYAKERSAVRHDKIGARTVVIGRTSFSLAAGRTVGITLHLSGRGLILLKSGRGRLTAQLRIAQASGETHVQTIHLSEMTSDGHGKRKRLRTRLTGR